MLLIFLINISLSLLKERKKGKLAQKISAQKYRTTETKNSELFQRNSQKIFLPLYFLRYQVQCSAQLCLTLCNPWTARLLYPWNFSRKNTGAGCHFFLQGIFPTQGLTPDLLCLSALQADSLLLSHWET